MREIHKTAACMVSLLVLTCALGYGQSLGDLARQQREKQKAKSAQTPSKVITNEDLPEHSAQPVSDSGDEAKSSDAASPSLGSKPAAQWQAEISAQKKTVADLQSQMERLNSSIHFANGNCVRNCVQYNEHQEQKQEQVQRMQSQLEEQKKKLDDMQEAARKEGFGNSVYEP